MIYWYYNNETLEKINWKKHNIENFRRLNSVLMVMRWCEQLENQYWHKSIDVHLSIYTWFMGNSIYGILKSLVIDLCRWNWGSCILTILHIQLSLWRGVLIVFVCTVLLFIFSVSFVYNLIFMCFILSVLFVIIIHFCF